MNTMSSRDKILGAIRQNKPAAMPLPDQFTFRTDYPDLIAQFGQVLQSIGGRAEVVPDLEAVKAKVQEHFGDLSTIAVTVPGLESLATFSLAPVTDPHDLEHIELAIIPGQLGVAENAAIWISENEMGHRVLPFITQHLALVIRAETLVANMHEAYQRIAPAATGFGTFLAGPSKTADIEQSLVVGAHGARSLIVYLIG